MQGHVQVFYGFSSESISRHMNRNHAVLKTAAQWVQEKSSSVYTTIEDIRRHACLYNSTAYQHHDAQFVNNIKINSQERVYCLHTLKAK